MSHSGSKFHTVGYHFKINQKMKVAASGMYAYKFSIFNILRFPYMFPYGPVGCERKISQETRDLNQI